MFNTILKYLKVRSLKKRQNNMIIDEKIWKAESSLIERQNKIDQEKKELKKKASKKPSWSKILLVFLFINFTALELFVGWVTARSLTLAFTYGLTPDFTPLITLIGAVIGETLSYGIYAAKSKAENTQGGIVYEAARWERENNLPPPNDDGSCG